MESDILKIGVIAGTDIDTHMGVVFLRAHGIDARSYPVAREAREQTIFQMMPQNEKKERIRNLIKDIKGEGLSKIMINCNSLSASVDMNCLSKEEAIPIITPLHAYKKIAKNKKVIGVLAGNNQALAGIERSIMEENPNSDVFGMAMLPLVVDVENKLLPEEIIEKHNIKSLLEFYESNGVESLVLGCTHFPYFKEALEKITDICVIDPASIVLELLIN